VAGAPASEAIGSQRSSRTLPAPAGGDESNLRCFLGIFGIKVIGANSGKGTTSPVFHEIQLSLRFLNHFAIVYSFQDNCGPTSSAYTVRWPLVCNEPHLPRNMFMK
jgi:hypothetical protein